MKVTNTGANSGSFGLGKQSKSDAFSREIENIAKLDEFKQTANKSKEAIKYENADGVFTFRSFQNESVVRVSMTKENIERFKQRFGDEISDTADKNYILSGKAEKYMSAFWEYYKEKQPDTDENGYIDYSELKIGKSLLVGYDDKNNTPVTVSLSDGFSDEELEKMGVDKQLKISVDEDFNALLGFDENIDGIIGKNEIGNGIADQQLSGGKDITLVRWLLWISEGMQDEDKKKKEKQTNINSENLRRKLMENINSLPTSQNSGKLAEVLQNLQNSLRSY